MFLGYGPEYSVKISCPACTEEFEHTFDLSRLTIKRLGTKPLKENENLFEYILPMSKLKVCFRLLNGADELDISKEGDKKKKLGQLIDTSGTSRLFRSVISINGETDRGKISRIIHNLRAGDAKALRNYINKINY